MPRLPQPGSDNGTWGNILNDYLSQALKSDGSLKDNTVGADQLQDNAITGAAIAPGVITATEIADDSIGLAKLAATGSASGATFLRGDGTWAVPAGGGDANLSVSRTDTTITVESDAGTDAVITAADGLNAGVMTAAQQIKLAGVASGATANDTDANLKNRANHTGTQSISTISDFDTAVAARIASSVKRQRIRDLPDRALVDTPVSLTITAYPNQVTTTISSGYAALQMPNVAGKASVVGTHASNLVQMGAYSFWGANWRANNDGTSGSHAGYTSSFGLDFWVGGSRYVEFSVGTLDTNLCAFKIWVDGRTLSDLPLTTTWTNPSQNLLKIDLGNTSPHRVKLVVVFGGIGQVRLEPGGSMWPAKQEGPRVLVFGDSFTGVVAGNVNTGTELGTWFPRFASWIGADDFWNAAISGTGSIKTSGGFPNYQTRDNADVVPSNADLIFFGGWANDFTYALGDVQTAYGSVLDTLIGMSSSPWVIPFGQPNPAPGTNDATFTAFDDAMRSVATGRGLAYVSFLTGKVYNETGTEVLDMGPAVTTANRSLLIGNDNWHASDLGHKVVAARMYTAYRALLEK